jgi:hypothetical protein
VSLEISAAGTPIHRKSTFMSAYRIAVTPGDRHRLLHRARGHRRRVFERRWPDVPGHRTRVCGPAKHLHASRCRPHHEIRLRTGAETCQETPDLGDEIEWHRHFDAVLGRTFCRDGQAVPRGTDRRLSHRHSDRALRPQSGPLRCRGGLQPVRRHPHRSGTGVYRHHRYRTVGQPQPRAIEWRHP